MKDYKEEFIISQQANSADKLLPLVLPGGKSSAGLVREHPSLYIWGRINPKNDFVFRKLFGQEQNKELLICLLNAILRRKQGQPKIVDAMLVDNRKLEADWPGDKESYIDLPCETDAQERINLEMQIRRQKRMDLRSLFYWSRFYTKTIHAGQQYDELKRTIVISLLDHNYLPLEKYHNIFHLYEEEQRQYRLTDVLELHYVEFSKFRKVKFDITDPLHRWLKFMEQRTPTHQLEEIMMADPAIEKAVEELTRLWNDPVIRMHYEAREKFLMDQASWLKYVEEEGMEKGIEKGIEQTALNMLGKVETWQISEFTGLSLEQIESLAKQHNRQF